MDPDTVCFENFNIKKKLFKEQLEDLLKKGTENKPKAILNTELLNTKEFYFRNIRKLSEETKQQQTDEFALLKEQNECSKHIADISKKIENMDETLRNLNDENSIGKVELKQIKKPLLKAIKKYSTYFDMDVEVKKHNAETFLASVKFSNKEDANPCKFLIDRKNRVILDFYVESLSDDEKDEIRSSALTENGLNVVLILKGAKLWSLPWAPSFLAATLLVLHFIDL